MLLQDFEKKTVYDYQIHGAEITEKIQEMQTKCYVTYESRTRKVIHILQVDFQQKLSLMMLPLQARDQFPKYKTQDVCIIFCFQC